MKYILIRWLVIAAALFAAVYIVPGIHVTGNGFVAVLGMAVVLGFANAIIRPILSLLSCGCIVATLGLFMLVVNAVTFYLASMIGSAFGLGFSVDSFWAAFMGSLVVSVVSFLLSLFFKGDNEFGR